jgi:hypothetical protein
MGSIVLLEADIVCYDVARIIDDYTFIEESDGCKDGVAGTWRFHRNFDRPALTWEYPRWEASSHWYWHGIRHRENGPVIVFQDGTMEWRSFIAFDQSSK